MGTERRMEDWRGPVLNQSGQAWLVAGGGGGLGGRNDHS